MPNLEKYTPPVDQLLNLGPEPDTAEEWFDYLKLGFKQKHIPQLIELATDHDLLFPEEDEFEEEDPLLYAPVHAWRTLGQMRAAEAVEPLLTLLGQADEYIEDEMPTIFAMIGEPSIEPLRKYIEENKDMELGTDLAIECLQEIGGMNPDLTDRCVTVLMDLLENYEINDESLNGFLISALAELRAEKAKPLMEEAFEAERVDEAIIDREEVELIMGSATPENQQEIMDSLRGVIPPELLNLLQQPGAMEQLKTISRQFKRGMIGNLEDEEGGEEMSEEEKNAFMDFFDNDLEEEENIKPEVNGKKSKNNAPKKKPPKKGK